MILFAIGPGHWARALKARWGAIPIWPPVHLDRLRSINGLTGTEIMAICWGDEMVRQAVALTIHEPQVLHVVDVLHKGELPSDAIIHLHKGTDGRWHQETGFLANGTG